MRLDRAVLAGFLAVPLLLPASLRAQEDLAALQAEPVASPAGGAGAGAAATVPADATSLTRRAAAGDAVALSLEQVIEMALQQNLDIVVSRYEAEKAANAVVGQEGAFDPLLAADLTQSKDDFTQISVSGLPVPVSSDNRGYNMSVSQQLDYGASWSVGADNRRFGTSGEDPSYSAGLTLTYAQPLLRNLGRDAASYGLRVAKLSLGVSDEAFRLQVLTTITDVIAAYCELVYANEDLAVKERSLELADDQLRRNRIMVEVGTLAPIDITVAEAEVAIRKEAIIQATNFLGNSEDRLRQALNVTTGSPLWDKPIYPLDLPVFEKRTVDVKEAYETALQNRPEVRQMDLQLETQLLALDYRKDQVKPQLDFTASLGYVGQARGEPGNFEDAWETVWDRTFENWSLGMRFRYPLGNQAARAELANARIDYESRIAQREKLLDDVWYQVSRAARDLTSNQERVEAARVSRRLQEQKVSAEQKKFEEGMSTNFQVLQFQRDLEEARTGETRAVIDYYLSVLGLQRTQGTLLERLGIQLVYPTSNLKR